MAEKVKMIAILDALCAVKRIYNETPVPTNAEEAWDDFIEAQRANWRC